MTKEQLAEQHAEFLFPKSIQQIEFTKTGADMNEVSERSYLAGYEDAQPKWISVEDENPHCYRLGFWDGNKSDFVVGKDANGKLHIACLYSGFIDGSEFNDWYDQNDYEVSIIEWCKIPD